MTLSTALNSVSSAASSIVCDVKKFREQIKGLTLAVFATIFTWGFVQGIKASILTPLIQAYVIPSNTEERLKIFLRRGEVLELGTFLAELIQWLIFMTLLFLIWKVSSRFAKQNSVKNIGPE